MTLSNCSTFVSKDEYVSYVYLIVNIITGMMYIGVRFRTMETRFHYIPYYDLIEYKSSSSDMSFKEDMDLHPENYEFFILSVFDTPEEAQIEEARLHAMFDVANNPWFYNRSNSECLPGSKYDGIELYDAENDTLIHIENIKEFNILHNCKVDLLFNNTHRSIKNRFYKITDMEYAKDLHKYVTLYKLNKTLNEIETITFKHKDGAKVIKDTKYSMLMCKKRTSVNGYYLDLDMCLHQNKIVTLFYKHNNIVETINIRYHEGPKIVGKKFSKLLHGPISGSANGYYLDKQYCENSNTDTLYNRDPIQTNSKYDGTTIFNIKTLTFEEILNVEVFNRNNMCEIRKLFQGVRLVKGTFCSTDDFIVELARDRYSNNRTISLKHDSLGYFDVSFDEAKTLVGDHFLALLRGKRKSANGFRLEKMT